MIDLVLHDSRPKSLNATGSPVTLYVEALYLDSRIPLNIHMNAGKAEATLITQVGTTVGRDHRVDQAHGASADLGDEEPLRDACLRSRQADTVMNSHQREHLIQNVRQPAIESVNRTTRLTQDWIRMKPQTQRPRRHWVVQACRRLLHRFTCRHKSTISFLGTCLSSKADRPVRTFIDAKPTFQTRLGIHLRLAVLDLDCIDRAGFCACATADAQLHIHFRSHLEQSFKSWISSRFLAVRFSAAR